MQQLLVAGLFHLFADQEINGVLQSLVLLVPVFGNIVGLLVVLDDFLGGLSESEYIVFTDQLRELHAIDGDPGVRMEYENIIFSLSLMDNQVDNDWARRNVLTPLQMGTLKFPRPIHRGTRFHEEVSSALDDADAVFGKRPDGYSLLVRSSLFRFFFAVYSHRSREESVPPSPYEDAIKQVLLYVQNHFAEPISVSDAASLIDYSDAHFMRVFHRETGFTFGEYLSDYRLRYASYLLRERPDSIGAIASICGFDNFSYFIRRFRRKYGMSPREYRAAGR